MRTCMDKKKYPVLLQPYFYGYIQRYQYIQGSLSDDGLIRQSRAWLASAWIRARRLYSSDYSADGGDQ